MHRDNASPTFKNQRKAYTRETHIIFEDEASLYRKSHRFVRFVHFYVEHHVRPSALSLRALWYKHAVLPTSV